MNLSWRILTFESGLFLHAEPLKWGSTVRFPLVRVIALRSVTISLSVTASYESPFQNDSIILSSPSLSDRDSRQIPFLRATD